MIKYLLSRKTNKAWIIFPLGLHSLSLISLLPTDNSIFSASGTIRQPVSGLELCWSHVVASTFMLIRSLVAVKQCLIPACLSLRGKSILHLFVDYCVVLTSIKLKICLFESLNQPRYEKRLLKKRSTDMVKTVTSQITFFLRKPGKTSEYFIRFSVCSHAFHSLVKS